MTEHDANELIAARFAAQWPTLTTSQPGGPYPFALTDEALPSTDFFAMCTWESVSRVVRTLGTPSRKQQRILILVKLWAPAGSGSAAMSTLCDIARQIFESQTLGTVADGVTIFAGNSGTPVTDGRWTMRVVSFPAVYSHQS